jgi:hypothetical protein
MRPPKVLIDANVLKFASTTVQKLVPHMETIDWAGKDIQVAISRVVETNPNDSITNLELKAEAAHLPQLAEAGRIGLLQYLITFEIQAEGWRMPNMAPTSRWFYDAPIEKADAPLQYARTYAGGRRKPKDLQHHFLASVKHPRFLELQRVAGAYQGDGLPNRNQLLDAFHLWCAEHNGCEFFLTLDFKLGRVVARSPTKVGVKVVRPSELLAYLEQPLGPTFEART